MSTLYFHIPFCRQMCSYCDFYKSQNLRHKDSVLGAMHDELRRRSGFITDKRISSIYFGGGTPSQLSVQELYAFVEQAHEIFDCRDVSEVTVECNPDDMSDEFLGGLARCGVNRLSVGVQSFDDDLLRFMNRRHTSAEAVEAVHRAQSHGFGNVSIDLIFGVDGYGEQVLERSLDVAAAIGVQHISAYHLTIERGTAFGKMVERGEFAAVADEQSQREYDLVRRVLRRGGFEQYEISNYAQLGFRSAHNSAYWQGVEYLGIGPSAHSFNGRVRHWSAASIRDYMSGEGVQEEVLTAQNIYDELVMTSLRCVEGVDLERLRSVAGDEAVVRFRRGAERFVESGDLCVSGQRVYIPAERLLISDYIISELFI